MTRHMPPSLRSGWTLNRAMGDITHSAPSHPPKSSSFPLVSDSTFPNKRLPVKNLRWRPRFSHPRHAPCINEGGVGPQGPANSFSEGAYDVDQARGRGSGRHDGSHRLRRDALRRTTICEGLAKAGPLLFLGASHPSRDRRGRWISSMELLVPQLPGRAPGAGAGAAAQSVVGRYQRRRVSVVSAQRLAGCPRPARTAASGRARRHAPDAGRGCRPH
jgi:hypothetical protein